MAWLFLAVKSFWSSSDGQAGKMKRMCTMGSGFRSASAKRWARPQRGQDIGRASMGSGKRLVLWTVTAWEGRIDLPGKEVGPALRAAASGGNVQGDLPQRTPQRGKRQIRTIPTKSVRAGRRDDASLRQPPPAAAAKNGFGRFIVSAACRVDLFWIYRGSLQLSTPWPWRRPVVEVPIPPCPVTRGRRA